MNRLLILVVVSTCLAYSQSKQISPAIISPEIRGVVTDESGAPVAGAIVQAVPQTGFNDAYPISVKADQDGHFDFRGNLTLGSYKLYARTGEEDSADPEGFYADAKARAPAIDLAKTHPTAIVRVKLSPRLAVVSGRIIDAATGEKLSGYLGFMDGEGHGNSVHVDDGDYRILLPPGKDVTLMVRLTGPPDLSVVPVAPLRLEPGQYVNLDLPVRR